MGGFLFGDRSGHDSVVTTNQPTDLDEIRRRLDIVDRKLVQVLLERSGLIEEVILFKRTHGMAVIDRGREDLMLERIESIATSEGLDPRIARQVLRAVIDAFTLLEVEHLGPDA
jgi:chorismate mutase